MFFNEKVEVASLPVYEVKELSMEEALLVLAAEKENLERFPSNTGGGSNNRWKGEHASGHAAVA